MKYSSGYSAINSLEERLNPLLSPSWKWKRKLVLFGVGVGIAIYAITVPAARAGGVNNVFQPFTLKLLLYSLGPFVVYLLVVSNRSITIIGSLLVITTVGIYLAIFLDESSTAAMGFLTLPLISYVFAITGAIADLVVFSVKQWREPHDPEVGSHSNAD